VDLYNSWFLSYAPDAYRETRVQATEQVERALRWTASLTNISPALLRENPGVLPILRAATAPPIARDRLIGLAQVSPGLVGTMEKGRLPRQMPPAALDADLGKIGEIVLRLAAKDIFPWLDSRQPPTESEVYRAATIVADRLCGAQTDPIVRNAQEQRQLALLRRWLEARGYQQLPAGAGTRFDGMPSGTFIFRLNIPVQLVDRTIRVNIPIDAVVRPRTAGLGELPLLIEAKSAGDFTNTNKRRKEEATKIGQLRKNYGDEVRFILLLCGYFDSGYLGYEASEGIDWVWEHRIDDLAQFGV